MAVLDELGSFYFTNGYFGWGSAESRNWAVWDGGESAEHWRRCDSLKGSRFSSEDKDGSYPGWQVIHRLTREASVLKSKPWKKNKKQQQPLFPVRRNHLLILRLPRKAPLPCSFVSLWKQQWAFRWVKHLGVLDAAETVLWLHMSCDVTSPGAGRGEAEACCGESG